MWGFDDSARQVDLCKNDYVFVTRSVPMPVYRRFWQPGGTYFFTVVTYHRRLIFLDDSTYLALREAFRIGMEKVGPFKIEAICLLPDHLHCIWTLPKNDDDYAARWKIIKSSFSHWFLKQGKSPGQLTASKVLKGELGVWQRRYWEHTIRDHEDLNRHIEYIHYNPVKHGLVQAVKVWPWSSFHHYVQAGYYDLDWGNDVLDFDQMDTGE